MPFKFKIQNSKFKILCELLRPAVFIVVTFAFYLLTFSIVRAQVPAPAPIPCASTGDPEFHSLRPYQASPCQSETVPYAKFCGNTLTLQDKIDVTYQPGVDNCSPLPGGKVRCSYVKPISETITIDLSNAKLPIMGNTENVPNSQTPTGSPPPLTDAEKVNGYVSWYLNGTVNRAEYPFLDVNKDCIGQTTQRAGRCSDLSKIIPGMCNSHTLIPVPDPLVVADGTGSCLGAQVCCVTINPLAEKVTILDRDKLINYSGPINKLLPQEVQQQERAQTVKDATASLNGAGIRHDQVVGCVYGINIPIINKVIGGIPGPCYETGLMSLIPRVELRLSDWANHIPPVRAHYKDYIDYEKALETWRGKGCIEVKAPDWIPVIGGKGVIFCFDNALNPNFFSALYPYIPLSSTEDVTGNIKVDSVSVGGPGITGVSFDNQTPSTLFFPHLVESDQLGSILQDTYIADGEAKTGPATAVAPPSSCTTVDVRSNAGDNLFATSLSGHLGYTASFTCDFNPPTCTGSAKRSLTGVCENSLLRGTCVPSNWSCTTPFGRQDCPAGYVCGRSCSCINPIQTCSKTVSIALSTSSNTPKIDDIWSRLVAGPTAVVKRMFPKLGTQIGTLKDIPGSTAITYSGAQASSGNLNLPHIGGISEYFLKGIQTLLRPKGYGEPISFGPPTSTTTAPGDICAVASKYKIPCCMLKGIIEVETANNPIFIGTDPCTQNGRTFNCCIGNYCGTPRIACNQYAGFNGNDNLDLCDPTDSAELLARAMLFKLCQADGKCVSGWAKDGNYILANYSIEDGDYTAAAYFYGLNGGCRTTSCSQFRWGAGKGYCDSVKSYCDTGQALESKPDV
ncbi:MAG: hypothetical protein NTZ07_02655, partial [Candidatus Woesebacteria bacterium]|nr:hypothetical protein [Candidatus Woesebacteria bacterium]